MGMYEQLTMTYGLKVDTPADVVAVHEYLMNNGPLPDPLPEHPLFQCDRWEMIGRSAGEYPGSFRTFTPGFRGGWEVGFSCSFKNYDDEINHWLDYIGPWVDSTRQAIGWHANNEADWAWIIWARYDLDGKLIQTTADADDFRWGQR